VLARPVWWEAARVLVEEVRRQLSRSVGAAGCRGATAHRSKTLGATEFESFIAAGAIRPVA